MKWLLALAAAALLAACPAKADPPVASVEVVRDGDGWTAEYRFHQQSPVWVLALSPLTRERPRSFRPESWTIDTPGVRLERRGWYDVLVAERGNVPARVSVRFKPFTGDMATSADPALAFTDGSVALYSVQWKALPAAAPAEVERYPMDIGLVPGSLRPTEVVLRDRQRPVLLDGERVAEARITGDRETYVLLGPAEPVQAAALTTVLDPALPGRLRDFTLKALPPILERYGRLLGRAPGRKPMLMLSWNGATQRAMFNGGVLPRQMMIALQGRALLQDSAQMREAIRWFVAHESAHFWLGEQVIYQDARDSWMAEGGADLLGYRTMAALQPGYSARAALQGALDRCLAASRRGPVGTANERGESKAHYDCGAIFGLVAERAWGGDYPAFVRELIATNRDDEQVSRAEWLALVERRAPGRDLPGHIGFLLDNGTANAQPWIALLEAAGIPFRLSADGSPEFR